LASTWRASFWIIGKWWPPPAGAMGMDGEI
jgi:hypothetical protein